MKKRGISIFMILLGLVVIAIIVIDFSRNKPGHRGGNPYQYDMESLSAVDPEIITHRESRNLTLTLEKPAGIAYFNNKLYVIGDQKLMIIEPSGALLHDISLPLQPLAVAAGSNFIAITTQRNLLLLDHAGQLLATWNDFYDNSLLSSVAIHEQMIFIADAGRRRVYRYTPEGVKELEIDGKRDATDAHGFIVPSGCFDLAVNDFGELWVANPGKHALENYSLDGVLRGYWEASFSDVSGFSGCCNPAHFTFLPDGNFVTSEKGIIRIKEYTPWGNLIGVVAAPSKFIEEGNVPDVATGIDGTIYAVDPDKRSIRIFESIL